MAGKVFSISNDLHSRLRSLLVTYQRVYNVLAPNSSKCAFPIGQKNKLQVLLQQLQPPPDNQLHAPESVPLPAPAHRELKLMSLVTEEEDLGGMRDV